MACGCDGVDAGSFRNVLKVEQLERIDDRHGGQDEIWTELKTIRVGVKEKSGGERFNRQNTNTNEVIVFTAWYDASIIPDFGDLRFVYRNRIYNFTWMNNIDGENLYMELTGVLERMMTIPTFGTDFVLKIKTDNAGDSNSDQFTFNATGTYNIDWGDGSIDPQVTGAITHTYSLAGEYLVKVSNTFVNIPGAPDDPLKYLDIISWGNNKWTTMSSSFKNCSNMIVTASDIPNLSICTNLSSAFRDCSSLTSLNFSGVDTSNVTTMTNMLRGCLSLIDVNFTGINTSICTSFAQMLQDCESLTVLDITGFDTRASTLFSSMFNGCSSLITLDLSNFKNDVCTGFSNMFVGCSSLTFINLNGFTTPSAINMQGMFSNCTVLNNLDVSGFDTTNVTNFKSMFSFSPALTTLDVSGFVTISATSMAAMFEQCHNLLALNLINFDTSNVTSMGTMFKACRAMLSIDVSGFDTILVNNMDTLFGDCYVATIIGASGLKTGLVTTMRSMFSDVASFDEDISGYDISSLTTASTMLRNSGFGTTNYDLLLVAWEAQPHNNSVTFHAGNAQYSVGAPTTARAAFIVDFWTISDGGQVP